MAVRYALPKLARLRLRRFGQFLTAILLCLRLSGEVVVVTRVIDGNSFEADGDRKGFNVQLVGVEVPRLATTAETESAAAAAKMFLTCLINRKAVEINRVVIPGRQRAVYAYVSLGELSVNEAVLQNGFGEVSRDDTPAPLERFRELERTAKRNGTGVWNPLGVPQQVSCDRGAVTADTPRASIDPKPADSASESPSERARARAERMLRRFNATRWTILFSTGEGMFGYDAKLTEREAAGRYLTWLRLDYVEAQALGEREYHYSLERVRVNCPKRIVQTLSTVRYNHQPDDTTKVVFSWTPAPLEQTWEPIVPESFGEKLYGELCTVLTARFERPAAEKKK